MEGRLSDVLIVGGGPAGSSCARELVRAGFDVTVLDRAHFPRDKVCAGWVTPPVFAALELDPDEYAREHVLQPIHGFAVSRLGEPATRIDYGEIVSYAARRCELDTFLLRRCGAQVVEGHSIETIEHDGTNWVVDRTFRAPVLVGAGGHFCPVVRHLGVERAREHTVVAKEIEFRMTAEQQRNCRTDPEIPELFFTRELDGYGWVVRKNDFLNVGIGQQDAQEFPKRVEAFLDELVAADRIPSDTPRKLKGHAYLLYTEAPRPLGRPGVLLVGDSAGMAYGTSGEGIRPAVESALIAARAIADGEGRVDARVLGHYRTAIEARFGARTETAAPRLVDTIPHPFRTPLVGRLLRTPFFTRRFVLDRWFLHREIPALTSAAQPRSERAGPAS